MCVLAVSVLSSASLCQTTIRGMSSWAPSTPKTSLTEEPGCLLTPPPTRVITPASCSLGLAAVVSVLVELCDVGGKRLSGRGQPCGMLLLREVGWGVRHGLGQKTKRAQGSGAFFFFQMQVSRWACRWESWWGRAHVQLVPCSVRAAVFR